jgi:hypothetical protein
MVQLSLLITTSRSTTNDLDICGELQHTYIHWDRPYRWLDTRPSIPAMSGSPSTPFVVARQPDVTALVKVCDAVIACTQVHALKVPTTVKRQDCIRLLVMPWQIPCAMSLQHMADCEQKEHFCRCTCEMRIRSSAMLIFDLIPFQY